MELMILLGILVTHGSAKTKRLRRPALNECLFALAGEKTCSQTLCHHLHMGGSMDTAHLRRIAPGPHFILQLLFYSSIAFES